MKSGVTVGFDLAEPAFFLLASNFFKLAMTSKDVSGKANSNWR